MFHTARVKLTAWYLVIIMAVSISFSAVIYRSIAAELDRFSRLQQFRIERRIRDQVLDDIPPVALDDPDLVSNVRQRVIATLFVINGSIFALSAALGYMLAGRTLKPIQEMVDEQNRFISDASHELRTPLTAMKSTMEVHLRDKHLTISEAKNVLKESIDDVNTLQSLSDSLLTLAQYQKPNGHETKESLLLVTVIDEALKRVAPMAAAKNITITYAPVAFRVSGIRHSLTDLCTILLDNAIKYSAPRQQIAVTTEREDKHIVITVTDHGIGIAKKDLPHIFDRFYRADTARTESGHNGYGLGLAIAKKIVEIHDGTITAKSTEGKGTTFTISLSA